MTSHAISVHFAVSEQRTFTVFFSFFLLQILPLFTWNNSDAIVSTIRHNYSHLEENILNQTNSKKHTENNTFCNRILSIELLFFLSICILNWFLLLQISFIQFSVHYVHRHIERKTILKCPTSWLICACSLYTYDLWQNCVDAVPLS
jgi:hypothetical protein